MILNQIFKQKEKKNLEMKEKTIVDYSTFDIAQIAREIAAIATVYEQEKYVHYSVLDTRSSHARSILHMIVPMDVKEDLYSSNGIFQSFDTTGKTLYLTNTSNHKANKNISFYLPHHEGFRTSINYGKFSYIKKFIDMVIAYKMKNGIDDISDDILHQLARDFISLKVEEIEEYHQNALNVHAIEKTKTL